MSDNSTILALPMIQPAQAQKHVTHNEALRLLDVVVQMAVTSRDFTSAPVLPAAGDRYIVAAGATGEWAGHSGEIALFSDSYWNFFPPLPGYRSWIAAEGQIATYDGTVWATLADGPLVVGQLGVSATPDATNRLSVAGPASLFNNVGAGHQIKVNKALPGDTASLLFQTGYSGRAEMGTTGTDDFAVKVSADGGVFYTAISVAGATGKVTLPAPLMLGGQGSDPATPANGEVWLNTFTGEVKIRSAGASVVIGAGLPDGNKGDITVSGGGTAWLVDPRVKFGLQIAMHQQNYFN